MSKQDLASLIMAVVGHTPVTFKVAMTLMYLLEYYNVMSNSVRRFVVPTSSVLMTILTVI
jgi:hypothetical protein